MKNEQYQIRFLPLFIEDLNGIVDYIAYSLNNQAAALGLVDAVEKAILERSTCAEAFEQYHSSRERQHPYYRIHVHNYLIFYVVIGDVMEIRRIIYNRRNINELI